MRRRTFLAFLPAMSAGCFLKDFTVARPQIDDQPPATAGVARVGSPSLLRPNSLNTSLAARVTTSPSAETPYTRSATTTGELE